MARKPMPDTLRRAINYLTIEQGFFASLLFEMRLIEVDPIDRPQRVGIPASEPFQMGTDGANVYWDRAFVESLGNNVPVAAFALTHEVCHPMLMHTQRLYEHGMSGPNWVPKLDSRGRMVTRDPRLWNYAGDAIINTMLKNSGFTLWDRAILIPKYDISKGWTTEKTYDDLLQEQKNDPKGGWSKPGGVGYDLIEPGAAADMAEMEEVWKDRMIRAATIAKQQGKLPAGVEELVKAYSEPVYPVWLLLERYVEQQLHGDDFSWRRPHPNFMNRGIIMPGSYTETIPRVDVWFDTSGSVSSEDLSRFVRILGDIMRNTNPTVVGFGQCDAEVSSYDEIPSPFREWPDEVEVTGRGGTSFCPPFDYLADRNIQPRVLIYLTDLCGDFPSEPPPYPVLWVSTTDANAPFGTTIHIDS